MNILLILVFLLLFNPLSYADATADVPEEKVKIHSQLRELGYRIGDIAEQTLTITTPLHYEFDESSLPTIGANASSVELVSVHVRAKNNAKTTEHTIHLRWQHFRSMPEIRYYPLMPLNLKFNSPDFNSQAANHQKPLVITVTAGKILVAPLIPTVIAGDTYKNLRPDVKPQLKSLIEPIGLLAAFTGLALLCLGYLSWHFDWFNWQLKRLRPFRKAYREIRPLSKNQDGSKSQQDLATLTAIRTLRQAFNGCANTAISAGNLTGFLKTHHWLTTLQQEIEDFFKDSERVFFAGTPSTLNLQQLRKLSQRLMQLESTSALHKNNVNR